MVQANVSLLFTARCPATLDVMVGHDVIDNIERDFLEEEGFI